MGLTAWDLPSKCTHAVASLLAVPTLCANSSKQGGGPAADHRGKRNTVATTHKETTHAAARSKSPPLPHRLWEAPY